MSQLDVISISGFSYIYTIEMAQSEFDEPEEADNVH